jgi:predicted Zn-ribbon and HTH transcriptional regulator
MMEQEELELIKRLQNTQIMQKTAYDDLENALNGSFNKGESQQLLMSPSNNNDRGYTPNNKSGSVMNSGGRP